MDNLSKIKGVSKNIYRLFSFLLPVIPLCYVLFWVFINDLPTSLINVNTSPATLIAHELSWKLRFAGLAVSLLPLSAITYGLFQLRRLFSHYKNGDIFSYAHVGIFKNISRALVFWVIFSILYDSATSVIFSYDNPPGQRTLKIGFDSGDFSTIIVGLLVLIAAWVMDEGRVLAEENKLTV